MRVMDANTTLQPQPFHSLSDAQLSRQFDSACAIANQQYVDGCDTTAIDCHVNALMAELERRGS